MTDPASTALAAPRLSLGGSTAAYQAAVERARVEDWATRLFARDATLWTSDQRVAEAIAERLGWLDAPAHFADRTVGLEAFGDAVVDEGFAHRGRRRDGRQQPRPGRPPPDVRLDRGLPRAAHPRLDRPGLRVGDARRPRPAPHAGPHRHQVGDDDRTERLPGLRLGSRREGPQGGPAPCLRSSRASTSRPSPTRTAAVTSSTPTNSARSSSTRRTSAAATRR